MTIKSFLKPVLLALCLLPLSSCSSLFKPKTMTIEYDEEVKLHDGEMIWVHITRHYIEGGGQEISEMFQGRSKSVIPTHVEISWDTGFEGVGRKSVFFNKGVSLINKYDNKWYIAGASTSKNPDKIDESINCSVIGVKTGVIGCIASINQQGEFFKANSEELYKFNNKNILYPVGIKGWGSVPRALDGKEITWNEKLQLQQHQIEKRQIIGKPYIEDK